MRQKWPLIASWIQLIIGIISTLTIFLLALNGENLTRWLITLVLAIAFVVLGVMGIINYKKTK